jgi:hypothetical protein
MTMPSIVSLCRFFEARREASPFAVRAEKQEHGHPTPLRRLQCAARPLDHRVHSRCCGCGATS